MKIFDLKPTAENVLDTYLSDSMGRNTFVFQVVELLNSIEGSCSVALEGKWGSGKTFFVKQVELVLNANNEFTSVLTSEEKDQVKKAQSAYFKPDRVLKPFVSVYYDAWENDNDDDPILSLVYAIMHKVSTDYSFVDRDYLTAGTAVLDSFLETKWTEVIDSLKGDDPLSNIRKNKNIEEKVNDFLSSLLPERGERLVVFIDELDRCSPNYAIRLLERIKHYFENESITFIFSVNINELQYTVKKYYGEEFDGARYLDRFFDLRLQLPEANLSRYYGQLNFSSRDYTWSVMCDAMIRTYHMEPRTISRYLQLYRLAVGNHLEQMEKAGRHFTDASRYYCLMYVAPIMIALKLVDPKKYYDFIEGRDSLPLISASCYLLDGFFFNLLALDENFEPVVSNPEIKVVTKEEKLQAMYEALFVTDYNLDIESKRIGKTRFGKDSRDLVMGVVSLLSQYARYDD